MVGDANSSLDPISTSHPKLDHYLHFSNGSDRQLDIVGENQVDTRLTEEILDSFLGDLVQADLRHDLKAARLQTERTHQAYWRAILCLQLPDSVQRTWDFKELLIGSKGKTNGITAEKGTDVHAFIICDR